MSRHHNPFAFDKPITLDNLDELFSHHSRLSGGWSMTSTPPENEPPTRPDDIPEADWEAIGDPGKQVIARERAARQTAERALAASRARPAPPRPTPGAPAPTVPTDQQPVGIDAASVAEIVKAELAAALKPIHDRDSEREQADKQRAADAAAKTIADAVTAAATGFHDPADALSNLDLTQITDGNGGPDAEKIKTQLAALLTKKPYLGKAGTSRVAPPGVGTSPASGGGQTTEDLVQASLARMQKAAGIRAPQSSTTS